MLEASEWTCALNCNGSVTLFLLQRCDHRDTSAAHLPIVFSKIRRPRHCKHIRSSFSQCCGRFLRGNLLVFSRHCCWRRNFQHSTSGFHGTFQFFIIWFNEEYTYHVIVCHYRTMIHFCCALLCVSLHQNMLLQIWLYIVGSWGCLFPRKSPPGPCISVRLPFVQ